MYLSECQSLMCDGVCIQQEFICDGKVDCSDMTDEIGCEAAGKITKCLDKYYIVFLITAFIMFSACLTNWVDL